MSSELDQFACKYDNAEDKEEFHRSIGDVVVLSRDNRDLYIKLTTALGITDGVENELDLYLIYHHSNQNGKNRMGDRDRVYAMMEYLIQTYVDVSFSIRRPLVSKFLIMLCMVVYLFFQHNDVAANPVLNQFRNKEHPLTAERLQQSVKKKSFETGSGDGPSQDVPLTPMKGVAAQSSRT